MLSKDIRKKFLKYFLEKGHKIVPSSSVCPIDDTSLLFVNAGMNQFKDVFLGKSERDYKKAVTSQKCIRVGGKHNDLENVGHTTRHLTFFEMLGNFSFGDYFKKEAIKFAFEVTTNIFQFDPQFLYASVFEDDDESFELWQDYLPEKHIVRMGEKENFWSMGNTGPCGPCSELLYDRGKKYSDAPSPLEDIDGERYLEFWNLVFMEFDRAIDKSLNPLPQKSIDTGAGLERVISLQLGKDNVFQTDILQAIIKATEKLTGIKYLENNIQTPAFHVIADHLRSLSFAIADGVQPSNIERGYVLRKILRRAIRYGRILNLKNPFLAKLVPALVDQMGDDFNELKLAESRIQDVIEIEEVSFLRTLDRGGNILQKVIEKTDAAISGKDAFLLKDTYGLPIDEILLIAKDSHKNVDLKAFETLEQKAKDLSRNAQKSVNEHYMQSIFKDLSKDLKDTKFLGYEKSSCSCNILKIMIEDQSVESLKDDREAVLILDQTPFYAEMGGQIADKGEIQGKNFIFQVTNCRIFYPGFVAHIGFLKKGEILPNTQCLAIIDKARRVNTEKNHTATHLLQYTLRQILGDHITQAGSLVEDIRLRFDFNHHTPLAKKDLKTIEMLINEKIRTNQTVKIYEIPFNEAQMSSDIMQIFGEKYADIVRVVDIDFSKELCGGTHVNALGEIGFFKIIKELGIAKGVRRIEAVTGFYAEQYIYDKQDLIDSVCCTLKTDDQKILARLDNLLEISKQLTKENKEFKKLDMKRQIVNALSKVENIKNIPIITIEASIDNALLQSFANEIMQEFKSGILAIATRSENSCQFLIKISNDFVEKNIHANTLIKTISPIIQGGGGGKKDQAQAGGKNPNQIPQAFVKIKQFLEDF
jgi:alanyl-tRNA synthetase